MNFVMDELEKLKHDANNNISAKNSSYSTGNSSYPTGNGVGNRGLSLIMFSGLDSDEE